MRWKRIPKEHAVQPSSGQYSDWKQRIADEGFHQCVYCAIHEASFGGIRNFHIEHYRPKSKFPDLINDIKNLYYACPICNTFKSNDWPSDTTEDFSRHCYSDPSLVDYSDIFDTDRTSGMISGRHPASKYMVERVYLNRPQLIMERRVSYLLKQGHVIRVAIQKLLEQLEDIADTDTISMLRKRVMEIQGRLYDLVHQLHNISPYRIEDIERR